ncbi:hypothetical protein HFO55_01425 [Rhizobium leguminosarum]|uniref:hypothetical protein n=1 Tax=Rhizobium leguminosarum TaxID=384 RepID=UPI001C953CA0|nr:hypothetical protein [Rhizobium leguminosarum]MBY5565922.1 hypothetical protein [Rhizobium leguminosarum]MBY5573098.1 hypothetical protein [Rhizobium leguminosarum]
MIDDDLDMGPSTFVFHVPGHRRGYHLTQLLPYFGTQFCERLAEAWSGAAVFEGYETSYNYFQAVRRAFLLIALTGAIREGAEQRILEGFRDKSGWTPSPKDWEQAVVNLSATILNPQDDSFIASQNRASRNKKLESLRIGFRWLSNAKFFPTDIDPQGRLEDRDSAPSKCLATLSYEAGRLDLTGLTGSEAADAFMKRNTEMLEEVRRCLWSELEHNFNLFKLGQQLMEQDELPKIEEIDQLLMATSRKDCALGKPFVHFALTDIQRRATVLRLYRHRASGGSFECGYEKIIKLAGPIILHVEAQPYFEATTEALNAAFHLVLIDAVANVQPIEDLPFDLRLGPPRNNKQQMRSVKNRGRKRIRSQQLYLTKRSAPGRPSGVDIVEIWKSLTSVMRASEGPTATRLWVWRRAGTLKINTTLATSHDRWDAFLKRHEDNPLIGKLPITRQILRTAAANSQSSNGEFDLRMITAKLGHSSSSTTFEYLSESAIRALLVNKIRIFSDSWESIGMLGIDEAARLLGVPDHELYRRRQLGLENGLAFAAPSGSEEAIDTIEGSENSSPSESLDEPELLANEARIFTVTAESLTALVLAHRALRAQLEQMLFTNPGRFIRTWMPWLAIVEGYCDKLANSGYRVKFRKTSQQVDKQIGFGELSLPALW